MSDKTHIFKEEKRASDSRAAKDRLTLLLGENAAGDLKLKSSLIYHSENTGALKGCNKEGFASDLALK